MVKVDSTMTNTLTLKSPAKVNLFLRVLNKREDGYHNIASLFQALNLCDTLHFTLSDSDSLTCTDPAIPTDSKNLVIKAIDLFRAKTQKNFCVKVHIEKKIPVEAGLGGGSSNAATTLWALNELCTTNLTTEELLSMAAEIGSDVPFFLSQGTAFCSGRGELLQSMQPLPFNVKGWIVKPPYGMPTPAVYQNLDLSQLLNIDPAAILHEITTKNTLHFFNDLETSAFKLNPELSSLKESLVEQGAEGVIMCGSGSSFFSISLQSPQIRENHKVFDVEFLNRSSNQWY